jgi:antitoxin ParD1/3/4
MRLWQKREEEHQARLSIIRERLEHSAQNGTPVPLKTAFESIEALHKQRIKKNV